MLGRQRRIRRTREGTFEVRLPPVERNILRALPGQLRTLLSTGDPSLSRLFPPAYGDDREMSAEFDRLMREDLLARHMRAVEVLESTVEASRLDEEQLTEWLGAINDLRLVLGTRLDVTEDMYEQEMTEDDPRLPLFALFQYLGWLEEQVVEALAS